MNRKISATLIFIGLFVSSCCFAIKEEFLGNNLYLSEYDNVDRRILYSKEECSGSGIEIVPMTVLEYSFDDKWIIAKSGSTRKNIFQYWVIKNNYSVTPDAGFIKDNMLGPLDLESFNHELKEKKIDL